MICEKCGCHDRVTRTIRKPDRTIRVRRCIACGDRIETEERKVSEPVEAEKPSRPKRSPKKKSESPKTDDSPKGALAAALSSAT